jgi:hypothetical protein
VRWDAALLAADLPDLFVPGRMCLVTAVAFDSSGQSPVRQWSEPRGCPCDARAGRYAADRADRELKHVDLILDSRNSRVPGWSVVESLCAYTQCCTHSGVAHRACGDGYLWDGSDQPDLRTDLCANRCTDSDSHAYPGQYCDTDGDPHSDSD